MGKVVDVYGVYHLRSGASHYTQSYYGLDVDQISAALVYTAQIRAMYQKEMCCYQNYTEDPFEKSWQWHFRDYLGEMTLDNICKDLGFEDRYGADAQDQIDTLCDVLWGLAYDEDALDMFLFAATHWVPDPDQIYWHCGPVIDVIDNADTADDAAG